MAKDKTVYICQNCEAAHSKWAGQCNSCGQWNTLVETVVKAKKSSLSSLSGNRSSGVAATIKLTQVKTTSGAKGRIKTKIGEFDRVLGGGIVPGSVVLVGGEPGIGKSTLLTQLAINTSSVKQNVLYVCGEESPEQVKMRVERLVGKKVGAGILLLPETDVDSIITTIESIPEIGLVIVDSIQTISTTDLTGMAGSVGQVRESSQRLLQAGKKHGIPVFLVGHVTKSGTLAGPKVLEHLVDAVLDLTGERTGAYRILRASKNRFGATDEVGVFSMSDKGMEEVANPSAAFLEESQTGTPGSAVVAIMEGTRPVLVEIQALVINSQLAIPRRVSNGISINKVQLLTAVLQKRCGLVGLGTSDIFVNVAGGIHIKEPAADIGIALAIASSLKNQSLPVKLAVIGEIGLLGEIRQVSFLNKRVAEAKKLGFSQVVAPNKYKNLNQVVKRLFS